MNPTGRLRIVHIDFTAAEVDARYQPAVEVVADVREALELLAPLVAVQPERAAPARPPTGSRDGTTTRSRAAAADHRGSGVGAAA